MPAAHRPAKRAHPHVHVRLLVMPGVLHARSHVNAVAEDVVSGQRAAGYPCTRARGPSTRSGWENLAGV